MASSTFDGIALALFGSRVQAICDEMGVALRRAAFSPNIKDRLDFSCALFDAVGALFGQAAHIPVHLGSMAYAMADIVSRFEWRDRRPGAAERSVSGRHTSAGRNRGVSDLSRRCD